MLLAEFFAPHMYYRIVFLVGLILLAIFWLAGWAWAASKAADFYEYWNRWKFLLGGPEGEMGGYGASLAAGAALGAVAWRVFPPPLRRPLAGAKSDNLGFLSLSRSCSSSVPVLLRHIQPTLKRRRQEMLSWVKLNVRSQPSQSRNRNHRTSRLVPSRRSWWYKVVKTALEETRAWGIGTGVQKRGGMRCSVARRCRRVIEVPFCHKVKFMVIHDQYLFSPCVLHSQSHVTASINESYVELLPSGKWAKFQSR